MKVLDIAVLPGDGIGKEVMPEALEVLRCIEQIHGGLRFNFAEFPWNCEYYCETGKMMPDDGLHTLAGFNGVFLGAVGDPTLVLDHISLWGLLLKIRKGFRQTINLRPAKQLRGVASPLVNPNSFDLIVVRENSEGEYSEIGGRIHQGEDEIAVQNAVFTRKGSEAAMRYAFELAQKRRGHVTSATKSNGIYHTMPFWDQIFKDVQGDYPEVKTNSYHIDALAAFFVSRPHLFDVVVASNLFGDILTDLGGAIMGSIGIAPSININLDGKYPSMFEPVHGSAPDIYGKGIANPVGQIWTAKMMLDHFGEEELGSVLLQVVEDVMESGIRTADVGGTSTTREVGAAIRDRLKRLN